MRDVTLPVAENTIPSLFPPGHEQGFGKVMFLSVLCVSEDPLFLDRICRNLERNGDIFVEICNSAGDALHLMNYLFFDAVVTDCVVWQGKENGFLKAMREQGIKIPLIYFIRRLETRIRREARLYGGIRYLGWREQASSPPFGRLARCIRGLAACQAEMDARDAFGWQHPAGERTF